MACDVTFRFIRSTVIPSGDEITSIQKDGTRVYVGTAKGKVYLISVRKQIDQSLMNPHYQWTVITEESVGSKPVLQIELVKEPLNYALVLCGGIISIYSIKELNYISDFPCKTDISMFCCNDGIPSYGLCIYSKKKLLFYDLNDGKLFKNLSVSEQPRVLRWFKKHVILGLRKEYIIISVNQSNVTHFSPVTHNAIAINTPTDELVIAVNSKAVFSSVKRNPTRDPIQFKQISNQFSFCFPFIFSLSDEYIEIANIVDPNYYTILKKPSQKVELIANDGKEVIIADLDTIYTIHPKSLAYITSDTNLWVEIRKNPTEPLLKKYFRNALNDINNPYTELINQFANKFVFKFFNPEEADIQKVKRYLHSTLRKLRSTLLSLYGHYFKLKSQLNIICYVMHKIFYSKIYFSLLAMMFVKNEHQDSIIARNYEKFINYSLDDFGCRSQFWLTEESLKDAPQFDTKTDNEENGYKNIAFDSRIQLYEGEDFYYQGPLQFDSQGNFYIRIDNLELNSSVRSLSFSKENYTASWDEQDKTYSIKFENDFDFELLMQFTKQMEEKVKNSDSSEAVELEGTQINPTKQVHDKLKKPYEDAIKVLSELPNKNSPQEKLKIIVKTYDATLESISDFWSKYKKTPVVGADDLVPIFNYIVLNAHIPKLYSEMQYVWEFATDAEMEGRCGYCFATFQIGVEVISKLHEEEKAIQESSVPNDPEKTPLEESVSQPRTLDRNSISKYAPKPSINTLMQRIRKPSQVKTSLRESKQNKTPIEDLKMTILEATTQHRDEFLNFLSKEKSGEYLLCLESIRDFQTNPTEEKARELLATFIDKENSVVYTKKSVKDQIQNDLNTLTFNANLFDNLEEDVLEALELDFLSRFQQFLNTK